MFIFPKSVQQIFADFTKAKYEICLVGGCVRGLLMNHQVEDWDFTTNAVPEEILKLYPDSYYDNKFGTVWIPQTDMPAIQITTYRIESDYADNRHPEIVKWGKTIEEDLSRRDFTINALAMTSDQKLTDPYQGREDIKNKIIRCVGNPDERFVEDGLRIMRAIRIAAQLGFVIEEKTLLSIQKNSALISNISGERIRDELIKLLKSDNASDGIRIMCNCGILQYILPELANSCAIAQAKHHKYDVYNHLLESLKHCPSNDWLIRFATLLHDIGKPVVAQGKGQNRTFYNHEIVGAKMAYAICQRLHFTKEDREKLCLLIRWHMFSTVEFLSDSAVRRFIRRIGPENIKNMIDLRIADRLGGGDTPPTSWRLNLFMKRLIDVQKHTPSVKDLQVNGHDVMEILKIKPGPQVGQILNTLFEEITDDPEKNERDYLLKRIKELTINV